MPVNLYSKMVTFKDSNKSFTLDGDLLETKTSHGFSFTHSNPQDQKQIYEVGKYMKFNMKQIGRKINQIEI